MTDNLLRKGTELNQDLHPSAFFSWEKFDHKKIFENSHFVWEALLQLKKYLDARLSENPSLEIPEGVYAENPSLIFIGKGTRIEKGAYLKGPCWIGENCEIRQGAYVREYVLTGNQCLIGHSTEIKHSILLDGAKAPHFNYVGDSILGSDVNLGAGVKCANFRLDHAPIAIKIKNERIETGLKKMGAVLGDGVQLGCNSVTNPGTILGRGVCYPPCSNIKGYIPHNMTLQIPQGELCL